MEVDNEHVHIIVTGRVQGVFYRASTQDKALQLNLVGWVRNTSEGNVEIEAQGSSDKISEFVKWCNKGPQFAKVDGIEVQQLVVSIELDDFEIRH